MKTSRKAAHLLAGSIMTAATIVGGAGVAAATDTVAVRGEATDSYYKVVLEDIHISSYQLGATDGSAKITDLRAKDGGTSEAADFFLKIDDIKGESL